MNLKRPLVRLLTGSLLFCSTLASSAQAASPYDDGMQDFNLKRYHAAEIEFENAIAKNPYDTRTLMMLGKTREFLKDPDGAKEAYSAAFNINPFNEDGAAAKKALMDLTANVESKKHAPLDDASTMRKTATTIQRQAQQLGQRYTNYGNDLAAARNKLTADSYRGDQIRNGELGTGRGFYRYRMTWGGELSSWDRIQNSYRQFDDRAQAINYRSWATKNAVEARKTATNLVSLLGEHGYATNPHLRALGTNLYVRNYGAAPTEDLPPEDPLLGLRAKAWTLSDMPSQLHAKQQKL